MRKNRFIMAQKLDQREARGTTGTGQTMQHCSIFHAGFALTHGSTHGFKSIFQYERLIHTAYTKRKLVIAAANVCYLHHSSCTLVNCTAVTDLTDDPVINIGL